MNQTKIEKEIFSLINFFVEAVRGAGEVFGLRRISIRTWKDLEGFKFHAIFNFS